MQDNCTGVNEDHQADSFIIIESASKWTDSSQPSSYSNLGIEISQRSSGNQCAFLPSVCDYPNRQKSNHTNERNDQ